jgi:hypothetical protein
VYDSPKGYMDIYRRIHKRERTNLTLTDLTRYNRNILLNTPAVEAWEVTILRLDRNSSNIVVGNPLVKISSNWELVGI